MKVDSILMGYRAAKQASTKYSLFYLLHKWDMRLPVDVNVGTTDNNGKPDISGIRRDDNGRSTDVEMVDETIQQSLDLRKAVFSEVEKNIQKEQAKQKNYYDKRLTKVHKFKVSMMFCDLSSACKGYTDTVYIIFEGW